VKFHFIQFKLRKKPLFLIVLCAAKTEKQLSRSQLLRHNQTDPVCSDTKRRERKTTEIIHRMLSIKLRLFAEKTDSLSSWKRAYYVGHLMQPVWRGHLMWPVWRGQTKGAWSLRALTPPGKLKNFIEKCQIWKSRGGQEPPSDALTCWLLSKHSWVWNHCLGGTIACHGYDDSANGMGRIVHGWFAICLFQKECATYTTHKNC